MDDKTNENNEDMVIGVDGSMDKLNDSNDTQGATEVNVATPPPSSPDAEAAPAQEEPANSSSPAPAENTDTLAQPPTTEEDDVATADNTTPSADVSPETAEADPTVAPPVQEEKKPEGPNDDDLKMQAGISHNSPHKKQHDKRNNKKFLALLTVIVAVILIGVVVFVYLSMQENTQESSPAQTTNNGPSEQVDELAPATESDVQEATDAVDEAITNLNEEADFGGEEQLSDEELGL